MPRKKHEAEIAQLYVDLDAIYDRLKKLASEVLDDRHDTLDGAMGSVSDACGMLSYVADAAAIRKIKGAKPQTRKKRDVSDVVFDEANHSLKIREDRGTKITKEMIDEMVRHYSGGELSTADYKRVRRQLEIVFIKV